MYLIKIAFIGVFLRYVLRNYSLIYLSVPQAALIMYVTPLIALLYNTLFLNIFVVVALLVFYPGVGLLVAAMYCYLYWSYCSQQVLQVTDLSAGLLNGISSFLAGSIALLVSFFCESGAVLPSWQTILVIIISVIISSVIAKTVYLQLTRYYSITFLTLSDSLGTAMTSFFSWLLLGELVTIAWLSCYLLLMALYLVYYVSINKIYNKRKSSLL